MERLIFLDVDGVLNGEYASVAFGENRYGYFNPLSVLLLYRLVTAANASIVMSSTWRTYDDHPQAFFEYLKQAGWPAEAPIPLIGSTPVREDGSRSDEILQWLAQNRPDAVPERDYVILDDDTQFAPELPHIHVDSDIGFSHREFWTIVHLWKLCKDDLFKDLYITNTETKVYRKKIQPKGIYH